MKKETEKLDALYSLEVEIINAATDAPHDTGEIVTGTDGKRIYVGLDVLRPGYHSEGLGREIPGRRGVVKQLYRQRGIKNPSGTSDVTVQCTDGRYFWADQCKRATKLSTTQKRRQG
jgi:hypothetical protein